MYLYEMGNKRVFIYHYVPSYGLREFVGTARETIGNDRKYWFETNKGKVLLPNVPSGEVHGSSVWYPEPSKLKAIEAFLEQKNTNLRAAEEKMTKLNRHVEELTCLKEKVKKSEEDLI